MKPTQQEIIELAREAGIVFDERAMPYYERLVHLALERFGAGGYDWRPADCAPLDGSHFLARTIVGNESVVREAYFSGQRDISGRPVFCVPITKMLCVVHEWTCLPTDLRAEYLRGLEDAKKACESWANQHSSASGGCTHVDCDFMAAALDCAEAIEALKGKQ